LMWYLSSILESSRERGLVCLPVIRRLVSIAFPSPIFFFGAIVPEIHVQFKPEWRTDEERIHEFSQDSVSDPWGKHELSDSHPIQSWTKHERKDAIRRCTIIVSEEWMKSMAWNNRDDSHFINALTKKEKNLPYLILYFEM